MRICLSFWGTSIIQYQWCTHLPEMFARLTGSELSRTQGWSWQICSTWSVTCQVMYPKKSFFGRNAMGRLRHFRICCWWNIGFHPDLANIPQKEHCPGRFRKVVKVLELYILLLMSSVLLKLGGIRVLSMITTTTVMMMLLMMKMMRMTRTRTRTRTRMSRGWRGWWGWRGRRRRRRRQRRRRQRQRRRPNSSNQALVGPFFLEYSDVRTTSIFLNQFLRVWDGDARLGCKRRSLTRCRKTARAGVTWRPCWNHIMPVLAQSWLFHIVPFEYLL